jgi:uncharacterized membrane protein YraQ (UPF0718 family)
MNFILTLLKDTALYLLQTLQHNAIVLILGIVIASALRVYVDAERMKRWLLNRSALSIPATVAFGAFTPFCACGTMAVVLGMLASSLPWGAIMAFLTSSPLMSPDEFVLISGMLGTRFAIALTAASVFIGLGAGYLANLLQKRTAYFDGQLRFAAPNKKTAVRNASLSRADLSATSFTPSVSCCAANAASNSASTPRACCSATTMPMEPAVPLTTLARQLKLNELTETIFEIGVKKILPLFTAFAAIGYLINRFVPSAWISAIFGAGNLFAVPLAAFIGLPLYVSGNAAIPLIDSLFQAGVSPGAMLAFMITGPGTSAGVIAGISSILKRRAIAFYLACLMIGAIVLGFLFDMMIPLF